MFIETSYQDETLKLGVVRNLIIANWDSPPSAAQLDAVDAIRSPLEPYVFLNVIYNGVPSFSEDARRGVNYATQKIGKRVALGYVILVPGFGGAAIRAFVSTSVLLARSPNPIKVFSTVAAAAPWISGHLTNGTQAFWKPDQVLAACASLRDS